jgi:thiamine biosynthesis lipoprotein
VGWSRRDVLIGAGSAFGAAAMPGIAGAAATRVIGGAAFGTYWRVTLPAGVDVGQINNAIGGINDAINSALSPFRPGSEISRFNRSASTGWMTLGKDAARVMGEGLRIAALTGGGFDPTVGPIVGRFGFGPITGHRAGTYQNIAARGSQVKKDHPGLTFDPCGIAKGFALDRIVDCLDGLGIAAYLAEFGGEVYARGTHPGGRPWQVGIERPLPAPFSFQRILRLEGMALATSGDSVNNYVVAGRRYSHIIDPRKGAPVSNGVAAVSVIAARAITADALATGLMAMGSKKGLAFAERNKLPVLYLLRGKGGFREIASTSLGAYVIA